jgi:Acetoacetate decarboxylase (ADC)
MANLPPYVSTGDRIVGWGPYLQQGTILHNFCINGDKDKIQQKLDTMFAEPSGGEVRYHPIMSKLFLSVAEIARIIPQNPIDYARGGVSEIDVTIWAVAHRAGSGPFELRWIPLFLAVDNDWAMATGREVYGFPKEIGKFHFDPQTPDPADGRSFRVDAFAIPHFSPQSTPSWLPLFEIKPQESDPDQPKSLWEKIEHFADEAVERMGETVVDVGLKVASEKAIARAIHGEAVILPFLKQFPDVADPMRACYQAIVEAPTTINTFRRGGLTKPQYQVKIHSYDTHPFFQELGIKSEIQDVGRGMWVDFDFTMDLGTVLWQADTSG